MSKPPAQIKTLDELRARKFQLKEEILVSQKNAKASIGPAKSKLGSFALSKLAPVAAIGVGLFLAFKVFGGNDDNKKAAGPKISEAQLAFLEAERQERVEERRHVEEQAIQSSPGFVSIIRGFLPFIKVILPLAQSAFASYQAARATSIAKSAEAKADS